MFLQRATSNSLPLYFSSCLSNLALKAPFKLLYLSCSTEMFQPSQFKDFLDMTSGSPTTTVCLRLELLSEFVLFDEERFFWASSPPTQCFLSLSSILLFIFIHQVNSGFHLMYVGFSGQWLHR